MNTKNELREAYKVKRNSLDADVISSNSVRIQQSLFQCTEYQQAEKLFVYIAMASEVRTAQVIEHGWACGKTVAVPVVMKDRSLCFVQMDHWNGLEQSRYGIMEPKPDRIVTGDENTLAVVPGLLFSADKYRIGYGGGYYDRFFANHAMVYKIGIAYDFQVVSEIPYGPYDRPVDKIITEKRIIE